MELQQTLQDLADAMAEHRRVFSGGPPGVPAPPPDLPGSAPPVDGKRVVIRRLMDDVQTISGIRVSETVEAKLVRIFANIGLSELEGWAQQLRLLDGSHPEWLSLIESLTVHETYFYRDPNQLDFLSETMLPAVVEAARAAGRRRLRLWSAGCATGEEAFTLAMLALEALVRSGAVEPGALDGLKPKHEWQIEVLGTDISRLVLRQAEGHIYQTGSLSSFRDLPPRLDRFFEAGKEAGTRRVRRDLTKMVSFRHFNLLSAQPPGAEFDLVACRNVMIYMTPPARRAAQNMLDAAIRPSGLLLLGPTDTPFEPGRYDACWGPSTVIYRKRASHG
jgi:chemotaxis protein methyltransferase CheR